MQNIIETICELTVAAVVICAIWVLSIAMGG
ncbi:hypothetical protein [Caudoviricetes sp.]|jgi:hypothetical protein|nr:hypothetical protein [Caudoviricetes sp.]